MPNRTPLDPAKIAKVVRRRSGRREIVEAVSADGRWLYHRLLDVPYTPWEIIDQHTEPGPGDSCYGPAVGGLFGSLPGCREWTAEQPPSPQQVAA